MRVVLSNFVIHWMMPRFSIFQCVCVCVWWRKRSQCMQSIEDTLKILCLNCKRNEIVTKPNFFNFVVVSEFNFKNQPILQIDMSSRKRSNYCQIMTTTNPITDCWICFPIFRPSRERENRHYLAIFISFLIPSLMFLYHVAPYCMLLVSNFHVTRAFSDVPQFKNKNLE